MELIYQNFDGLELSFQCAIPTSILDQLKEAKNEAQITKSQIYTKIGFNGLGVMVYETGAKGGYQYQFSTGHDGQIWLIGSRDERNWNVRVRTRSLCLALHGYENTKELILKILCEDLRAKGPPENGQIPKERVSRIDYCMDFLIQGDLNPDYRDFVCHGRTKKMQIAQVFYGQAATGQCVETITLGKMPNRQATIYNKLKEIKSSGKKYWLKIWELDEKELKGNIWRVEVRAGKKELNKWNLKSFEDLEDIIGDLIVDILRNYKYTTPNKNDSNITRWPMKEIWQMAISAIEDNLLSRPANIERKEVLKIIREEAIYRYEKLISAIMLGYTAAMGKHISEIPGVLDHISGHVMDEMILHPQKMLQKYHRKLDQFRQLEPNSAD